MQTYVEHVASVLGNAFLGIGGLSTLLLFVLSDQLTYYINIDPNPDQGVLLNCLVEALCNCENPDDAIEMPASLIYGADFHDRDLDRIMIVMQVTSFLRSFFSPFAVPGGFAK